jgi:hypothetical protein
MKTIPIAIILLLSVSAIQAQQLTNNSFEEWSTGLNPDPIGFGSFDQFTFTDLVSQSNDAQDGAYSVKISTQDVDLFGSTNRVPGFMFNSPSSSLESLGVPYNASPTKLKGWTKYNVPGLDTAGIVVVLTYYNTTTLQSDLVAASQAIFTGNQNTWTSFEADFAYSSTNTPDTLSLVASSSLTDSINNQLSTIWFDNLILEGVGGTMVSNPIVIDILKAGPNPSSGDIYISTPDFSTGDYLNITDITGRQISMISVLSANTGLHINNPGVYFVELNNAEHVTIKRTRIIIQ